MTNMSGQTSEPPLRCYMIVFGAITDRARFAATYQAAVGPLSARFGGRYLLRGQNFQTLEGAFPDGSGAIISVWPDRAAALAFWHSPDYAEVKKLRAELGQFQVILVDAPPVEMPAFDAQD